MSFADLIVPKASVLEVVANNNCLGFNRGQILTGRLIEKKVGDVIIMATKEAAGHPDFESFLAKVREIVDRGEQKNVQAPQLAWCHYHKARIGHTIDNCPDVRCRTCHLLGHTNRVCSTPKCEECGKFGHSSNSCKHTKCEECGRSGHVSNQCYRNVVCGDCGTYGHPTEKCRKSTQIKPVWCSFCEVEGDHPTSDCEDLKYHVCETCGEKGHFLKNCRNPRQPKAVVKIHSESFVHSPKEQNPYEPKSDIWAKLNDREGMKWDD